MTSCKIKNSFCKCVLGLTSGNDYLLTCNCGENESSHPEWSWKMEPATVSMMLSSENKLVLFHPVYSVGTCIVKGDMPLKINTHYYWELKICSNMYGTNVMLGVGAVKTGQTFVQHLDYFLSYLGLDDNSWGYSYQGSIHHSEKRWGYGPGFEAGTIIGVHLDTYRGTLEFFNNRKSLGIAFENVRAKDGFELYPMASSTMAHSAIKIISAVSRTQTLQLLALNALMKTKKNWERIYDSPGLIGLINREYWWLISSGLIKNGLDKSHVEVEKMEDTQETCSRVITKNKPHYFADPDNAIYRNLDLSFDSDSDDERERDELYEFYNSRGCQFCRNSRNRGLCTVCHPIL